MNEDDASPHSAADLLGPGLVLEIQQQGRAAALDGRHVRSCPWSDPESDRDRARREMWVRGYAQGMTELRGSPTRGDVIIHNRNHPGFSGSAWLIEIGGAFYIVSATFTPSGPETLVFATDPTGTATAERDVVIVNSTDHEEAIRALLALLSSGHASPPE